METCTVHFKMYYIFPFVSLRYFEPIKETTTLTSTENEDIHVSDDDADVDEDEDEDVKRPFYGLILNYLIHQQCEYLFNGCMQIYPFRTKTPKYLFLIGKPLYFIIKLATHISLFSLQISRTWCFV